MSEYVSDGVLQLDDQRIRVQDGSADNTDRRIAIQKLVSVCTFANQDSDPCWVLEGLYLGARLSDQMTLKWNLRTC